MQPDAAQKKRGDCSRGATYVNYCTSCLRTCPDTGAAVLVPIAVPVRTHAGAGGSEGVDATAEERRAVCCACLWAPRERD